MPGQLAVKIREKFPGQYDDMDDATLEAAILKKYPDYADLTEESTEIAPTPTETPEEGGGLWQTLTDPLWEGPQDFAQSIADYIDPGPRTDIGPKEAMVRGGLAGMIGGTREEGPDRWRGAGGVLSDVTSPIELGGMALGGAGKLVGPGIDILKGLGKAPIEEAAGAQKLLPSPHHRFTGGVGRVEGGRFGNVMEDVAGKPEGGVLRDPTLAPKADDIVTEATKPVSEVVEEVAEEVPKAGKASTLTEVLNLPRALQSSMDISAPMRQGLGLIHTKAWWTSWDDMLKSFGSEKAYDNVMDTIRQNPMFDMAEKSGVKFTDLRELSNREEAIMNTWAEKVPFVRRSNRAYTAFLNKLRMDHYDTLVRDAHTAAKSVIDSAGDNQALIKAAQDTDPAFNPRLANDLAQFVNNATGRGDLGKLEKNAQLLNTTFYSPRFIASRVQMMNPKNYVGKPAYVRRQYVKSMAALTGMWTSMAGMAGMAGAEVSLEPTSSDFGKIKIGNTRIDPAGGFQQYLVLFNRLRKQETTSSTSGNVREFGEGYNAPTSLSTIGRFTTNKFQPLVKFAWDALNAGEDAPFNALDRTAQLFIPMIMQDIIEVSRENPELLPLTIPLTAVGMGGQTYGKDSFGEPLLIGR